MAETAPAAKVAVAAHPAPISFEAETTRIVGADVYPVTPDVLVKLIDEFFIQLKLLFKYNIRELFGL
jgi:hypothetical protein